MKYSKDEHGDTVYMPLLQKYPKTEAERKRKEKMEGEYVEYVRKLELTYDIIIKKIGKFNRIIKYGAKTE